MATLVTEKKEEKMKQPALAKKAVEKKSPKEKVAKDWYLVDAKGKVLGRMATRIAIVLMGKNKPSWQPYKDSGDYVIVTNASKVEMTGRKMDDKVYYHYSGYPGGLKTEKFGSLIKRKPQDVIYHSVKGMLPKTRLGNAIIKKLFVYPGETHPHESQKPKELEV